MFRPLLALALIGVAPLASAQTGGADNTQINRATVPAAVMETARYYAPDLGFTEFGTETEDGALVYEIGGFDPFGHHVEIDVTPDGTLLEIEWETPFESFPAAVRVEFEVAHPDAKVVFSERSIRANGNIVYEIDAISAAGDAFEFEMKETSGGLRRLDVAPA